MMNKNKITDVFSPLMIGGLIICGLTYSSIAQEAQQAPAQRVASPVEEEETRASPNITISSENSAASSQERQSSSPSHDASDATKASSDTNTPSANSELDAHGVTPTDSSMVPPTSTPVDHSKNAPLPIDPNEGGAIEMPAEETSPVNSTESIEKRKHEIKVRYNEVRTQVEKEEAVAALRQAADKATTPEGERQTLRAYYELLFKRMKQVDSSLTERCDLMQGAYLRRLEQIGIEPTIPLHLPKKSDQ